MKRIFLLMLFFTFCVVPALANAEDEVLQFSSEVLALESRQVLEPDLPFTYGHPIHGAALRRILDPLRTQRVFEKYFDNVSLRKSNFDLAKQVSPLVQRYETAFEANPTQYEAEYLDSLELAVEILRRTSMLRQTELSPVNDSTLDAFRELALSVQSLMSKMRKTLAANLRDKVAKGVFSSSAKPRALELALRLEGETVSVGASAPAKHEPQLKTRALMDGRQIYSAWCSACHSTGAGGAPRIGDVAAWSPRLKQGLPVLLNSTVRGKGAMASQDGGGTLDPVELERVVVYLSNQSGGRFPEPALPAGHPGTFTYREPSPTTRPVVQTFAYGTATIEERMLFGERVYSQHCAACHQNGGQGVARFIPPLKSARTFSNNESVIRVVLKGVTGTSMPGWSVLNNNEIAAVVNYMREKFGNDLYEFVQPEDVKALR